MFTPISIDKFVRLYLKKNPDVKENVLRVRLEAALEEYKNGKKCQCGKDIWIVGSMSSSPFTCFSCISGNEHPIGDYEIDVALEKRDKYGRRHIDEMDPWDIHGIFDDDGYEINMNTIKMPSLCLKCAKNVEPDIVTEILCNLARSANKEQDDFQCYDYRKL